jgi:hypothetical protein
VRQVQTKGVTSKGIFSRADNSAIGRVLKQRDAIVPGADLHARAPSGKCGDLLQLLLVERGRGRGEIRQPLDCSVSAIWLPRFACSRRGSALAWLAIGFEKQTRAGGLLIRRRAHDLDGLFSLRRAFPLATAGSESAAVFPHRSAWSGCENANWVGVRWPRAMWLSSSGKHQG